MGGEAAGAGADEGESNDSGVSKAAIDKSGKAAGKGADEDAGKDSGADEGAGKDSGKGAGKGAGAGKDSGADSGADKDSGADEGAGKDSGADEGAGKGAGAGKGKGKDTGKGTGKGKGTGTGKGKAVSGETDTGKGKAIGDKRPGTDSGAAGSGGKKDRKSDVGTPWTDPNPLPTELDKCVAAMWARLGLTTVGSGGPSLGGRGGNDDDEAREPHDPFWEDHQGDTRTQYTYNFSKLCAVVLRRFKSSELAGYR
ncbi:hypothetical protein T492DRAFT_1044296 [Pavlovales sp. CCMP2436]|nr:hypothetical protein T492DRAFT_1044296 [Pavlovales sp. CCMP2436]